MSSSERYCNIQYQENHILTTCVTSVPHNSFNDLDIYADEVS